MSKKYIVWLVVLGILGLCAVGFGYVVLNAMFPVAEPIERYIDEPIVSIEVFSETDQQISFDEADLEELMRYICVAEPTREMSVNDYPTARPYYKIIFTLEDHNLYCFIYRENGVTYAELPYMGVYEVAEGALEVIEKRVED